jgi:hypothetical protein
MKKKARLACIVAFVLTGGVMMQFGGCLTALASSGIAAIDFCSLLGPNCVLGPIAPCGDPTTTADDLLLDCPKPAGSTTGGGGGQGGGGAGS